jgi:hypothetical protein
MSVCNAIGFKKNIRYVLLSFSFCSLLVGVLFYVIFRKNNLLINDIFNIRFLDVKVLDNLFFISFIRYNLPDGLWLLSGILLLRALWIHNQKTSQIYVGVFILFAFSLEIIQYFSIMPGTFDVLDLVTMGIFALFEQITYKFILEGAKKND